jgi:hypothetical protein
MKYKSYREIMEAMNRGEIPRQHLGPKNFAVLKQELFSLKNEYKPQTFTEDEFNDWNKKLAERMEEIEQLSTSEKDRLIKEVDDMLNP